MSQSPGSTDVFGPLRALLEDPSVSEIMVNGPDKIFIEQKGMLKKTPLKFGSSREIYTLIEHIARAVGRTINEKEPYMDARLPDGSRVNAVIPPVAVDGPSLTIRRFPASSPTLQDLVGKKALDEKMAYFLHCCVVAKINILISGGTGSGKTTLLNALSYSVPSHERIVSIEDAAELKLVGENIVRLESRPESENSTPISIKDLLINALRMRPDRIIVGEVRGVEANDLISAMNTGHDGSLTTIHSNNSRDALRRLESLLIVSQEGMTAEVARYSMSRSIDLVIQVNRFSNGARRVTEITEIGGMEGDIILTQELFNYKSDVGFQCLGFVPRFVSRFAAAGIDFPKDFFSDTYSIKMKPKV
ncbi:CpaF family protein [bacterium]|nr:CpaF family protein [bacterium]